MQQPTESGFTLIELLIVLAIVALLYGMALPGSHRLYQKNQMTVVADNLVSVVNFSKLQARALGQTLRLSPLPDGGGWSNGMQLLVDNQGPQKALIHEWRWKPSLVSVAWKGFQSDAYLLFSPDVKHSAMSGSFVIQGAQEKPLTLIINRLGRVHY